MDGSGALYDELYTGHYRQSLSGFEIARWKALEHFIKAQVPADPSSVLDYGAGVGLHLSLWQKAFPRSSLRFCDVSTVAGNKFRERHPDHADSYRIIREGRADYEDDSFDVIVSVEVMEHVEDLAAFLRDIHRVLKPGGAFVWTTPCANALSIEHIYSTLTKRIDKTKEGYRRWRWEDPTHVRRLKSREARRSLTDNGFTDIRFRFRSHLFSFVCNYAPPRRRARRLREKLMTLDYSLFRRLPNGASMLGVARAEK